MPHARHVLLAALFAAVALLAACGDDDGNGGGSGANDARDPQTSSDAELALYFRDVEAAKAEHDDLLPAPLVVLFSAGDLTPQQQLDGLIANFTKDNAAITGMLAALEGIDIPSEVASEHREVLRTLDARFAFQETMIAQWRTGLRESPPQINQREGNLREHGGALCVVQSEAQHYGVEIDLGCDVEEVLKLRRTDRTTEALLTGEAGCTQQSPGEPASQLATFIDFLNRGPEAVDIYQLTPDGERIFRLTLQPGEEHVQVTYFETRWLVTDQDGECIGTYTARDIGTNLAITPNNPND